MQPGPPCAHCFRVSLARFGCDTPCGASPSCIGGLTESASVPSILEVESGARNVSTAGVPCVAGGWLQVEQLKELGIDKLGDARRLQRLIHKLRSHGTNDGVAAVGDKLEVGAASMRLCCHLTTLSRVLLLGALCFGRRSRSCCPCSPAVGCPSLGLSFPALATSARVAASTASKRLPYCVCCRRWPPDPIWKRHSRCVQCGQRYV